jgi:hypothetical protein
MNTAKAASLFISRKRSKWLEGSFCLATSKAAFKLQSREQPRALYRLYYSNGLRLSLYNGCLFRKTPSVSRSMENFPQRPY